MAGNRQVEPTPLEIAPGLLLDATPRTARNRWIDGDYVRWVDGDPEKMGGFTLQGLTDENDVATLIMGKVRGNHDWDSLDGQNWIAVGTPCKLYIINNNRIYDITPLRKQSAIVNGISTTNASAIVTITDPGHDAVAGDHVTYAGATAVGGITISGAYTITEVIDLDTYTITHSSPASSTAGPGGGVVTAQYDISCGLESDGFLSGYGTGDYGEEEYGTARSNSTFRGYARIWSLDNWGEDLIASPSGEAIYVWRHVLGPNARATLIENAPRNCEFVMVGPDDRHLIAFGCNTATGSQQQDKMFIRWCKGDDYDTWLASSENDAGSKRLDTGSRLVTACKTRNGILISTNKALYFLNPTGGQDVYQIGPLGQAVSPMNRRSMVDAQGTVYILAEKDVYVWNGNLGILPCEVRSLLFDRLNRTHRAKIAMHVLDDFSEVVFDIPHDANTENSMRVFYNYDEKCWYRASYGRESAIGKSNFHEKPIAFKDGRMYIHESGTDGWNVGLAAAEALVPYLESWEGEIGGLGGFMGLTHHLIPDFSTLTGTVHVLLFGRDAPGQVRRTSLTKDVTSTTEIVDINFRARQQGLRVYSDNLGDHWQMGQWRLLIGPYGRR